MNLQGKKAIQLVHNDYEDLELWYPVQRLQEAGVTVHLAGENPDDHYKGKNGIPVKADYAFQEINSDNYDALLIPGGWAPDKLRRFHNVLEMVRDFHNKQKTIAHICHAGWVLSSACILSGVKTTSTPGIKDDIINAGAHWVDESAVADGHIISAQRPPDLPNYLPLIMEHMSR